jgi:hypothetical protein
LCLGEEGSWLTALSCPEVKEQRTELLYKEWLNMDVKLLHTDNKQLKENTHKEYRKYLEKIKSK